MNPFGFVRHMLSYKADETQWSNIYSSRDQDIVMWDSDIHI